MEQSFSSVGQPQQPDAKRRRTHSDPDAPIQSWWGSAYCQEDLGCGNSGFPDGSDSDWVIPPTDEARVWFNVGAVSCIFLIYIYIICKSVSLQEAESSESEPEASGSGRAYHVKP